MNGNADILASPFVPPLLQPPREYFTGMMWKTSLFPSGLKADPYIMNNAVTVSDSQCHILTKLRLHLFSTQSLSIDPPYYLNLFSQVLFVFL